MARASSQWRRIAFSSPASLAGATTHDRRDRIRGVSTVGAFTLLDEVTGQQDDDDGSMRGVFGLGCDRDVVRLREGAGRVEWSLAMKTVDDSLAPEDQSATADSASASETRLAKREVRWQAPMALLTAGVLPGMTARRTQHFSLWRAYLVHFVAAIAATCSIFTFVAWEQVDGPASIETVFGELAEMAISESQGITEDEVASAVIALVLIVLGIEGSYVLLALVVASWGAADEAFGAGARHAIRRTWLHTPHVLTAIVVAGVLTVPLFRAEWAFDRRLAEFVAKAPAYPAGHPPTTQALQEHWETWNENQAAYNRVRSQQLWWARHDDEIAVFVYFTLGAWWLWGLLRFVGAPRDASPIARPPMCEQCGYNLTGISMEGRCPECGFAVVESLGPKARPETSWHRRDVVGRWRALWRCTADAVFRPMRFGRQLRLSTARSDHRWFMAAGLPAVFLVAWCGFIGVYVAASGDWQMQRNPQVLWAVAPTAAYFIVVMLVFLTTLTAGLVGMWHRIRTGRNLTAGAIQAGCFLTGYLVAWVAFAFAWLAIDIAAEDIVREVARHVYPDRDLLHFLVWVAPNLLCFAGYAWLVSRVTSGLRYANR